MKLFLDVDGVVNALAPGIAGHHDKWPVYQEGEALGFSIAWVSPTEMNRIQAFVTEQEEYAEHTN